MKKTMPEATSTGKEDTEQVIRDGEQYLMQNYAQLPLVIVRARAPGSGMRTAAATWTAWAASPSTPSATAIPGWWRRSGSRRSN